MAENLNVSDKTISSWENERTYPDIEMVKNIDENVKDGKKWKKWKKLIIIAFVLLLVLLFITSHVKFV